MSWRPAACPQSCAAQKLTLTAAKYQATCTTSLAVGASKITAIYSGDKAYAGSTSAPLTQTVLRAPTDLTPSISYAGTLARTHPPAKNSRGL